MHSRLASPAPVLVESKRRIRGNLGPGAPSEPCGGRPFPTKPVSGGLAPRRPHQHCTQLRWEHRHQSEFGLSSRPREHSPETSFTSTNSAPEFSHPALPRLNKKLFPSHLQTLPGISSQPHSDRIPRNRPPSQWGRVFTGLILGSPNNLAKGVLFIR